MTYSSKKSLAIDLSKLARFSSPKMQLEQYSTPSEAAAIILWDAYQKGLIEDKIVVDLGAGTGILGIGALLLGAKQVIFVEKDAEAIEDLKENLLYDGIAQRYEILESDIADIPLKEADLVVMNPPFGTKTKHADKQFLEIASKSAPEIYSFHKSSTSKYIQTCAQDLGFRPTEQFPFEFKLGASMKSHRKKTHPVAIICWHLSKNSTKDL